MDSKGGSWQQSGGLLQPAWLFRRKASPWTTTSKVDLTNQKPNGVGFDLRGETKPQGAFHACIKCAECGFDFDDMHLEN